MNNDYIHVSDEKLVLIDQFDVPLSRIGVDITSIRLMDMSKTVEYRSTGNNPDYIIDDTGKNVLIRRSVNSSIQNGSSVLVSYDYVENFTIEYVVNDILNRVQNEIEKVKIEKLIRGTDIMFDYKDKLAVILPFTPSAGVIKITEKIKQEYKVFDLKKVKLEDILKELDA